MIRSAQRSRTRHVQVSRLDIVLREIPICEAGCLSELHTIVICLTLWNQTSVEIRARQQEDERDTHQQSKESSTDCMVVSSSLLR